MILGLTNEEATVLITLLAEVSEDDGASNSIRRYINSIYFKLKKQGYEHIKLSDCFKLERGKISCVSGSENAVTNFTHKKYGYFSND
jgi:hypothetical protein